MTLKVIKGNHLTQSNRKNIKNLINAIGENTKDYFGEFLTINKSKNKYNIKSKKNDVYEITYIDYTTEWSGTKKHYNDIIVKIK